MKVNIEPDELDVRIEVVPLIDIIFCILVFFMVSAISTAKTEALNVDLPQASSAQTQFGDTLVVEVDVLGQIIIQNTVVSKDQLSQLLSAYVAQKPQGVVVFQADKRLNYETVIGLFDLLRKVGGTRVALGTTDRAAAPQPGSVIPGVGVPPLPNQNPLNLGQPNLGQPIAPTVTPILPLPSTSGVPQNSGTPPLSAPNSTANPSVLPQIPTQRASSAPLTKP
jgi:biopolymer transport protein ExbD